MQCKSILADGAVFSGTVPLEKVHSVVVQYLGTMYNMQCYTTLSASTVCSVPGRGGPPLGFPWGR